MLLLLLLHFDVFWDFDVFWPLALSVWNVSPQCSTHGPPRTWPLRPPQPLCTHRQACHTAATPDTFVNMLSQLVPPCWHIFLFPRDSPTCISPFPVSPLFTWGTVDFLSYFCLPCSVFTHLDMAPSMPKSYFCFVSLHPSCEPLANRDRLMLCALQVPSLVLTYVVGAQ